jgi:signal peptidase II
MNRPGMSLWLSSAATVAAVAALDQWTKAWALAELRGKAPRTVVPGCFDLTFNRNTGGVFGVLSGTPGPGRRIFFAAATLAALALIFVLLWRWGRESRLLRAALPLVAGGAVGNLIDRVRFGSVVDFIDWYWRGYHWPTFNVADSAITVGAALILAYSFFATPPPAAGGDAR